ncbi:MAG TPA: aminotransferase class I/II-fold pyridoxal phosphate-dependent enzyme [Candidatus Limnocylindrales bacterium]|nr:aminotransferase class I/II-fold pyridoxal phosphate-dependent enzyme [Candidatus Limnocylindrales bacterium]
MTAPARPGTLDDLGETIAPFVSFFAGPIWARFGEPGMANFAVGNPQDMPLPGYVDALRAHLEPQAPDWFAYKMSEPNAQAAVAASLTARTGLPWDPADVAMTNGGFAAIAVAFRLIIEPGDEVIFPTPPWFFYEILIRQPGGMAVRVPLAPPDFDLDADAIAAAITPRTRAVLVNTPHNPSGRVFPIEDLRRLAGVLETASDRIGHPIYLISDEPYNRILFDGRTFHSPAEVYPYTITTYSYGKTLLAPGMRIGYLTVPPTMPDRETLRNRVLLAQIALGYSFPNALLQHAIEDLEKLSIDVPALQRRRDRLVPALRELGYETTFPEGTFYILAKSPIDDDVAFAELLAEEGVLVLPGTIVELPGWFRISLTATDEMIERGLAGFAQARERALIGVLAGA